MMGASRSQTILSLACTHHLMGLISPGWMKSSEWYDEKHDPALSDKSSNPTRPIIVIDGYLVVCFTRRRSHFKMVGWGTHRYQSDITEPTGMTCTRPKPYTPDAALPQTAPLSFIQAHPCRKTPPRGFICYWSNKWIGWVRLTPSRHLFRRVSYLVPTTPPVAHGKMRSEGQAPFSYQYLFLSG